MMPNLPNHSTDWEGLPPQSRFEERRKIFATETGTDRRTPPRGSMRPPMNVVVIRETPDSKTSSDSGGFTFTSPAKSLMGAFSGKVRPKSGIDRLDSLSQSSSSFKLMPRHGVPAMCSPSPTLRGRKYIGNRKRRAHSISSPSSCSEEDYDDSPMSAMGKEDFSSPRRSPKSTGTGTEGNMLRLDNLSIHSPLASRRLHDEMILSPALKLPSQNACRPGSSSFSAYSFSPIASVVRNNSGSLSGSAGSMVNGRTPCGSAMSSPRHVPLTVLSSSSQQVPSPMKGPSPMRLLPPAGRPPFHSNLSKMLHSLDGREDHEENFSPRRISRSLILATDVTTTPGAADTSCDMSEEPPRTPSEKPRTSDENSGPLRSGPLPRTPLPQVTLTPRTPLSARRNPNAGLPMFPGPEGFSRTPCAPSDNGDVGLFMDDLLEGFTGHTPRSSRPSPAPRNLPLLVFNQESSHSLTMSTEASPKPVTTPPTIRRNNSPPTFVLFNNSPRQSGKHCTPVRTNKSAGDACTELSRAEATGIKTKSVMTPSQSNNGFLLAMMRAEARAGVLEAETGSLSDSDEDEDFVLTCPLSTATRLPKVDKTDHQSSLSSNRRVKQRVRCTSNSHEMSAHNSSLSSMTSNQASSTSLFGMDIVEEVQSSVPRASTPSFAMPSYKLKSLGSSNALSRRDVEYGSSCSLHRGKSELSLGSLGFSVEGPNNGDSGRDLITPPIMMHCSISPPPLMKRPIDSTENCIPDFSICVTSADMGR